MKDMSNFIFHPDLIIIYSCKTKIDHHNIIFYYENGLDYEYGAIPLFSSAVKTKFSLTGSKPAPGAGMPYIWM